MLGENSIRSWAEQTLCKLCSDNVTDEQKINCIGCGCIAHRSCIGINTTVFGNLSWSCASCGPCSLNVLISTINEMKSQLRKLMNLPSEVETLQVQIDQLKFDQKSDVTENAPQKPKFPNLEKARSRLPSTASNTSKRARTEDETETDFVEVKPKPKPRKPLKLGTKLNDTPFLGAEPRPKRKHIYVEGYHRIAQKIR